MRWSSLNAAGVQLDCVDPNLHDLGALHLRQPNGQLGTLHGLGVRCLGVVTPQGLLFM